MLAKFAQSLYCLYINDIKDLYLPLCRLHGRLFVNLYELDLNPIKSSLDLSIVIIPF